MMKTRFLGGTALVAILLAAPSHAQMAVSDPPAETALATLVGSVPAGFGTVVTALNVGFASVVAAISGAATTQTAGIGKIMTAHAQEMARYQTGLKDGSDAVSSFTRPPNACHVATAALSAPAAQQGSASVAKGMNNAHTTWTLGGSSAATGAGGPATANLLVQNHIKRAADTNGGASAATAQFQKAAGLGSNAGDANDRALDPMNVYSLPTLDQGDLAGSSSWVLDLVRLGFVPTPAPMPDPKKTAPEVTTAYLSRMVRENFAATPFNDFIGKSAPSVPLHDWAAALMTMNGNDSSSLPQTMSWNQMMDTLINQRFGGANYGVTQASMNEEAAVKELGLMMSMLLQIEWERYKYDHKVGDMLGNQYAYLLGQNK